MKQVVTITGIRPDFIRMSHVFKALDEAPGIEHLMIHTGQHYDKLLSDVFFEDLDIRKPDYNLEAGGAMGGSAGLTYAILKGIKDLNLNPDLFVFLGDSNSVCCSVELKKQGYKIAHIEAGMRSYDKRMLEEINRTVCDHCSDLLFVYHRNYAEKLENEGITEGVHVVGNTITEPALEIMRRKDLVHPDSSWTYQTAPIYVDIHRPENFKDKQRMEMILWFCQFLKHQRPEAEIRWLDFPRTRNWLGYHGLELPEEVTSCPLMSYTRFLAAQASCQFLVSDSGTAQEEAALVNCPVIVPRDFTERPESVVAGCSYMMDLNAVSPKWVYTTEGADFRNALHWASTASPSFGSGWLFCPNARKSPSELIVGHIKEFLNA